jgi:hypothetical protein
MSIQKIFAKMYSEGASEGKCTEIELIICVRSWFDFHFFFIVGINQFLVSQSSLEDVFVSLG